MTKTITVHQRRSIGFRAVFHTAVSDYPTRTILCVALFVGQAFIYNGVTFDLGTLMTKFFHVSSGFSPVFLIMFAAANFLGPMLLGRLFDTVGRVPMITATYLGSALLGLLLAGLFSQTAIFDRWSFIALVMVTFFFASAGASAAYLTASEIFPMETRALAIAFYYAIGTAIGGIAGPLLFGPLINTGSRNLVGLCFLIGSVLMGVGAVCELKFGVHAEGMALEDVATPLSAEDAGEHPTGQDQPGSAEHGTPRGSLPAGQLSRAGRYRPGPGRLGTPTGFSLGRGSPADFDPHAAAIGAALARTGPTDRAVLARTVGAARWGPGVFSEALRRAVQQGSARRVSYRQYGPPGSGPAPGGGATGAASGVRSPRRSSGPGSPEA